MQKKIFVFIGVLGSGKDYLAREYIRTAGAVKTAFADPLRADIWKMIGWKPSTDQEYDEFKSTVFSSPLGIAFTGRDLLARYGTEIRRAEDSHHWCKQTVRKIKRIFASSDSVVITDCRFGNEIEYLKYAADIYNTEIEFHFCNFKSDRYNDKSEHESEFLAQSLLKLGFDHQDSGFNTYVKALTFCQIPECLYTTETNYRLK